MQVTEKLFSPMLPVLTIFILVFVSSIHGEPPFTRTSSKGFVTVSENGKGPRTTEMPPKIKQQIFNNLRRSRMGMGMSHLGSLLRDQSMPGLSRVNSWLWTPSSPSRSYSRHRMASPMSNPDRSPPGSPQSGRQSPQRWHSQPQSSPAPFQHSPSLRPHWSPSVPSPSPPRQPQDVAQLVRQVIELVNAERAAERLKPLQENQTLDKLATAKSRDMRDNRYFESKSPTLGGASDMMTSAGIKWLSMGEIIAVGQRTPEEVMRGWMKNPGHRRDIMSPKFTEVGVGYVEGGPMRTYWTLMFLHQLKPNNPAECTKRVIELVNIERGKKGLPPLRENRQLSKLATMKSADMRDQKYVEHDSPTYGGVSDMMTTYRINWRVAGENIAAGQETPEEVMDGWMNSPGHRNNIMSPRFTEIGVGYEEGGPLHTYWTQMFLKPRY